MEDHAITVICKLVCVVVEDLLRTSLISAGQCVVKTICKCVRHEHVFWMVGVCQQIFIVFIA